MDDDLPEGGDLNNLIRRLRRTAERRPHEEPTAELCREAADEIERLRAGSRQKLGSFWVDTGTVLVGDPCQFLFEPGERPHLTYSGLMELFHEQGEVSVVPAIVVGGEVLIPATERRDWPAVVTIPARDGVDAGLVVTVGVDGWYPVYVEKDAAGAVLRIVIECGGRVEP